MGGCGGREDFLARFLAMRWDAQEYRTEDLADGLRRYVDGDHPTYATNDPHCIALHVFLFETAPDPKGLLPLFAPHGKPEVDDAVLRRDAIASTIATSFMRRIAERKDDPHFAALYDALAVVAVNFVFDPAYGDAHTETSVDVGDFFAGAEFPPCDESRAALARHMDELLLAWRARVTRKGSSSFFGVLFRHIGPAAGEALVREWAGMDAEERKDLLLRLKDQEEILPGARLKLVEGLLDPSLDVREAAAAALRKQGAPVAELDPSAPDEEMERASAPLREWARKTKP